MKHHAHDPQVRIGRGTLACFAISTGALTLVASLLLAASSSAATVSACDPPAGGPGAFCANVTLAEPPSYQAGRAIGLHATATNTSNLNDASKWAKDLTIELPRTSNSKTTLVSTHYLPQGLLIAGKPRGDTSCTRNNLFAGCTAGHGTFRKRVLGPGVPHDRRYRGVFGIHRIYTQKYTSVSWPALYYVEWEFCTYPGPNEPSGLRCETKTTKVGISKPQADAGVLTFDLLQTGGTGTTQIQSSPDQMTVSIKGASNTLVDGTLVDRWYTVFALPETCASFTSRATVTSIGGDSVQVSDGGQIINCPAPDPPTYPFILRPNANATVEWDVFNPDGSLAAFKAIDDLVAQPDWVANSGVIRSPGGADGDGARTTVYVDIPPLPLPPPVATHFYNYLWDTPTRAQIWVRARTPATTGNPRVTIRSYWGEAWRHARTVALPTSGEYEWYSLTSTPTSGLHFDDYRIRVDQTGDRFVTVDAAYLAVWDW